MKFKIDIGEGPRIQSSSFPEVSPEQRATILMSEIHQMVGTHNEYYKSNPDIPAIKILNLEIDYDD